LLVNPGSEKNLMAINLKVPLYGGFGQVAGVDQQQLVLWVILPHGTNDGFLPGQTARLVAVSAAEVKIAVNGADIGDAQGFRLGGGGSRQLMTEG